MNDDRGGARRRLLMIAPTCDGDDVGEAWLAHQWASLLSEQSEVTLVTSHKRDHRPASQQLDGVRVVEWPEPPVVGRFERFNSLLQPGYARFYAHARRWIRSRLAEGERWDVAHQVIPAAMRYPSPAAALGIPLVVGPIGGSLASPPGFVVEEGAAPWYQRLRRLDAVRLRHDPLLRRTFESADCVVGIAPYVEELLAGVSVRRFECMGDVALHAVPPPVDRAGRTGPVRLLHVGRIVRTKGLRDVIRAMHALDDLDIVLDVLGEGGDRAACEALIGEYGLTDRVVMHGRVSRNAVDEFYARADVFVFPSYREPGGSVVLEAMSWGLPLIVCDRGGPASSADGDCALMLPARSPEQLAADCATAVRTLVEDRALRLRMGAAARERASREHLWSRRVERMTGLYDELSSPIPRIG